VDTYAQSQLFNHQNNDGSSSPGYDPVVDGQFDGGNQWTYSPVEPHRFSEATETMGLIEECMEGLTEQQKMAFYLREVEGESTDAVCNILSVTNTNLRVLIYRAKNRLRKCLEGRFAEEPKARG
jgi:RNA polymerase sigma-70 factor (ECF subfamily)